MKITDAHIIAVDDEVPIRNLLKLQLEGFGCRVTLASNGVEALASHRKQRAHLIVSDIKMPEMDGLQLLKELRESGDEVPVILITAFDDSRARAEAGNYQVSALLMKPYRTQELKQEIEKALKEIEDV